MQSFQEAPIVVMYPLYGFSVRQGQPRVTTVRSLPAPGADRPETQCYNVCVGGRKKQRALLPAAPFSVNEAQESASASVGMIGRMRNNA